MFQHMVLWFPRQFTALAWYTPSMTDREQTPTSPTGTVWPLAPLHAAIPLPLFVSAEGIEITQSGGRLTVVHNLIRFLCAAETCLMLLALLLMLSFPWIDHWVGSYHNIPRPALLPSLISSYQSGFWVFAIVLLYFVSLWSFFTLFFNRGVVTMNHVTKTVKAGGRVRSFDQMAFVQINKMQPDALRVRYAVEILWKEDTQKPLWYRAVMWIGTKSSPLGAFKQEANAEKIAAAVAEFANVPVEHRTSGKNSV
jgi:hypothetical protein